MPNDDKGSSLQEPYDIVKGVAAIDYYESLQNTTISMTITFIDVDQVLGRKGVTGGEYIDLTALDGEEDKFEIKSTEHIKAKIAKIISRKFFINYNFF